MDTIFFFKFQTATPPPPWNKQNKQRNKKETKTDTKKSVARFCKWKLINIPWFQPYKLDTPFFFFFLSFFVCGLISPCFEQTENRTLIDWLTAYSFVCDGTDNTLAHAYWQLQMECFFSSQHIWHTYILHTLYFQLFSMSIIITCVNLPPFVKPT